MQGGRTRQRLRLLPWQALADDWRPQGPHWNVLGSRFCGVVVNNALEKKASLAGTPATLLLPAPGGFDKLSASLKRTSKQRLEIVETNFVWDDENHMRRLQMARRFAADEWMEKAINYAKAQRKIKAKTSIKSTDSATQSQGMGNFPLPKATSTMAPHQQRLLADPVVKTEQSTQPARANVLAATPLPTQAPSNTSTAAITLNPAAPTWQPVSYTLTPEMVSSICPFNITNGGPWMDTTTNPPTLSTIPCQKGDLCPPGTVHICKKFWVGVKDHNTAFWCSEGPHGAYHFDKEVGWVIDVRPTCFYETPSKKNEGESCRGNGCIMAHSGDASENAFQK